jgi:hypothetical protein
MKPHNAQKLTFSTANLELQKLTQQGGMSHD